MAEQRESFHFHQWQEEIKIGRTQQLSAEAGVSQDELRQIPSQLRNMIKNSAPAPVPQPIIGHLNRRSPHNFLKKSLSCRLPQLDSAAPPTIIKADPVNLTVLPTPPSTPMPNPPANIANILSSLLKAGVLSTSGVSAHHKLC
jgi:pre-mRNA cleavage complex 2 protein Pcf11